MSNAAEREVRMISTGSFISLYVVTRMNELAISSATSFLVQRADKPYLITNWHVLSGRNSLSGKSLEDTGARPNFLSIFHNSHGSIGNWLEVVEPLYEEDAPRWLVHPEHGRNVDVVALPLSETSGVDIHAYDLDFAPEIKLSVAEQVSIIGFPFGKTAGGFFGIWIQGTVATEPTIDFDGLPCFLVDSRTRSGQSGSPVVLRARNGRVTQPDGSIADFSGSFSKLFGVYSGRISPESDLGTVWRTEVIGQIIDAGVRDDSE